MSDCNEYHVGDACSCKDCRSPTILVNKKLWDQVKERDQQKDDRIEELEAREKKLITALKNSAWYNDNGGNMAKQCLKELGE